MWLLMLILEVNWEKVLHASSSCSSGLFAPYGVWHSTQPEKKNHSCVGGGKASYFVRPEIWFRSSGSWKTKSKRRGRAGRQADRQQTDWRTSVSENSPNNLQPPTEVSPFVWLIERGACTMGPILITLVREIRTAEWTWDIRFQISLVCFVCAHRFNAHAGLVCVIYYQTIHFLRRRLYGLCGRAVERGLAPRH